MLTFVMEHNMEYRTIMMRTRTQCALRALRAGRQFRGQKMKLSEPVDLQQKAKMSKGGSGQIGKNSKLP